MPVSSSAHLILLPKVMGWQDQGLVNDVAAHVGSLVAVVFYLRKDLEQMLLPWLKPGKLATNGNDRQLLKFVIIATLPVMICGYTLYDFVSGYLRNPLIIAVASIVFGLILWWSDRISKRQRTMAQLGFKDAILIGVAQALALIPGTSRSGITMTAGLMLGMERREAARFSFLLAIPAIIMAGGYEGLRYFMQANDIDWFAFITVAVVSGISAWIAIYYFIKFLQQTGMLPYVIYRVGLGIVLLSVYM